MNFEPHNSPQQKSNMNYKNLIKKKIVQFHYQSLALDSQEWLNWLTPLSISKKV